MSRRLRRLAAASGLLALASCLAPAPRPTATAPTATTPTATAPAPVRPPVRPTPVAPPAAILPSARLAPAADLPGIAADPRSLQAFRRACPQLLRRNDASGLTRPDDWAAACADQSSDPVAFFRRYFTPVRLGDGRGLATGYYEPELAASRQPIPPEAGGIAILGRPAALVDFDSAEWQLPGGRLAGLVAGNRLVRPPARAAIEFGALDGKAPVLAWTRDRIGYFFLQIQGSGLLRLADGQLLRVGYAGHNGHPYVAIGRLLQQRLGRAPMDMFAIRDWLQTHPQAGIALMQENPRFIFLRQLPATVDGPVGALGVPLLAQANVAADLQLLPAGTPVAVRAGDGRQPLPRLAIIADSGSAIKGANRIDIFFGHGAAAEQAAGQLAASVDLVAYLPRAAAARLGF